MQIDAGQKTKNQVKRMAFLNECSQVSKPSAQDNRFQTQNVAMGKGGISRMRRRSACTVYIFKICGRDNASRVSLSSA